MKHLSVRPAAAKLMISCEAFVAAATTTEYSTANVSIR